MAVAAYNALSAITTGSFMKKILSLLIKPSGTVIKSVLLLCIIGLVTLGMLGHLDNIIEFLDSDAMTLKFGKKTSISVYRIIKSVSIVVGMFWATGFISDYANQKIRQMKTLKASNRAIISKAFQIVLYFIAFLILMDLLEIDLKTLTIFSGAVGIGIGFGLQKITSNFISGLILLFEKSVRVDDMIELDNGLSGFIRYTGARYTLVEAFDGREVMIPNEDLITGRVINWTYSHSRARVEINIGVSYNSDLEEAKKIILECAKAHPKCIKDPAPQCHLRKFGDNSADFTLYFWVADVVDGRLQPQSDVMISIWKKFKENGIEIPYPQRDVFVKNFAEFVPEVKKKDLTETSPDS